MPTLLALLPHPDDESYSFSGTIARAASRGWFCHVVAASSGERGRRHDGGRPGREALAAAREAELTASCALIGAAPPRFLRLPDGGLAAVEGEPLVRTLLADFAPDLILALGADGAYGHPDHIAVYRWITAACRALPIPQLALLLRSFPKGLFVPQYELCLGMMGEPPYPPASAIGSEDGERHYRVPVGDLASLRRASIAAHRTQLPRGDPRALFPESIVERILADDEYFFDASGSPQSATRALLEGIAAPNDETWDETWREN